MVLQRLFRYLKSSLAFKRNPVEASRRLGVDVGNDCRFIGVSASTFGSEPYLVTIGNHVTITGEARFVTHDGGVWVLREEFPELDIIRPISVGNNVFVGLRAIILPGVSIGDNVVIAAGSVVTKSFESNVVIGGTPAKVLRTLDEYRASAIANGMHTKGLKASEKRAAVTRAIQGQ